MTIFRNKKNGLLYVLYLVYPALSKMTGYFHQSEPYGHQTPAPDRRGQANMACYEPVGYR